MREGRDGIIKIISAAAYFAVFLASIILVFAGQQNSGAAGIPMVLSGTGGLILLLWVYNRKYK